MTLPPDDHRPALPPVPRYGELAEYDPANPRMIGYEPEPAFAPPSPPTATKRSWVAPTIAVSTVFLLIIIGTIVAFAQRENIRDLFTVWNYEPTSVVEGYITRTDMSDRGEFLFKASQPVVTGADDFNDTCGALEEGTGVLGCYLPATRTILLFDVTDDRLDGVEEVVAAHEMLHAAWDRMSTSERSELEPLLEAEATARENDKDFSERMELYARVEPGERLNELHSIIGTELADIDPELEAHYAEFFTDRAVVVSLHTGSEAVLTDIEDRATALVNKLDKLYADIEGDYKRYNDGFDKLNDDVDAFNAKNNAFGFNNQTEFDAERNALIARESKLVKLFASIQKRSDRYDELLLDLEALNSQTAELNKGLNIVPRESEF